MATTKPKSKAQTHSKTGRQGHISEVIGAVVDVEFEPGYQPELFEALEVTTQDGRRVILEVESDRGDNTVRCIAMDSTDGFRRGDPVKATGAAISVPVGVETLGRLFNVIGNAMDVEMQDAGVLPQTALVFGQMNEPPGARARVGLTGLTMAEYFRDEEGADVLLFVDNIFRYLLAGSEVSALLGRMPSAVGYQPTLASEMGELQERITSTRKGSITSVQAVYVPADDYTDPAIQTVFAHLGATLR